MSQMPVGRILVQPCEGRTIPDFKGRGFLVIKRYAGQTLEIATDQPETDLRKLVMAGLATTGHVMSERRKAS